MGWFSPIKGHYPSLGQIDKTLPVKSGNTTIERGMIIEMAADTVNADGAFKIAADATNAALLYIALQDYNDAQAGMAGTMGFDGASAAVTGVTAGVPTITGLSMSMEGEYETDQFTGLDTANVGDALTVANGHLTKATGSAVVVAYLTGKPAARWINNAIAKPEGETNPKLATRQGMKKTVIRFRTK